MTSTNMLFGAKRDTNKPNALVEKLESLLPKGYKFGVYHLSTPPTKTEALYSAPPGERPDKTYREDHFLAISIDVEAERETEPRRVLVLALEVFLFTTAFSTTLFVSKADSTGYLELLKLPKGSPSPIREISAAFVEFLVDYRQRKGIQTVVSLFARSQSQYLFPGSVENKGKHVLDDRGLVKWWCRVLNPLLESQGQQERWDNVKAYLVVPGLDRYETRAFLPRTSSGVAANWTLGHPLERISHYTQEYDWVPLRCLIPKFPDDPKSRFRDELDVEASKSEVDTGVWKSVKTLDQFWEMMAFRQECSSGRLTGFIWVVFDPKGDKVATHAAIEPTPSSSFGGAGSIPGTPPRRRGASNGTPQASPLKRSNFANADATPTKSQRSERKDDKKKKKKKLKGLIKPREPRIKTHQRNYLLDRPTSTAYYYWPAEGRGEKIVDETSYKRIVELLLHLDFATLEKATGSTARWIGEVGMGSGWGMTVVGRREIQTWDLSSDGVEPMAMVNNLAGLIKRKRADDGAGEGGNTAVNGAQGAQPINVLGSGLVRKKRKGDALDASANDRAAGSDAPAVNVLGGGLVRKKPKAA